VLLVVAGCGTPTEPSAEGPPPSSFGPLYLSRGEAEHPEAGAAGDVVECDTWGSGGFSDEAVYADGATATTPEKALDVAAGEWLFNGPRDGLRRVADEGDRVLYVLEVDGEVKQAVVVRDGPATEGAGGDGWYVESWALCDPVELPRSFTDEIGLQVWTDTAGRPVPTTELEAWRGPEHCDWQAMTFLRVGRRTYVGNLAEELERYAVEPFRRHTELPADAVDTGYRRDGDRLWLAADRKVAYVGTPEEARSGDVELWPSTEIGCE